MTIAPLTNTGKMTDIFIKKNKMNFQNLLSIYNQN